MASVLKCRVSVQFSVCLSVSVPLIDSRIASRGFSGSRYRSAAATAAIVYSKHLFWWEGYSPPKNIPFHPPTGCQIVCCKSFCSRGSESQIYHGNFLLMDSKHRKLFVIKQSKGCRFMSKKCTKIHLAAGLCPDPLGELMRSPRTDLIAAMGAYL